MTAGDSQLVLLMLHAIIIEVTVTANQIMVYTNS